MVIVTAILCLPVSACRVDGPRDAIAEALATTDPQARHIQLLHLEQRYPKGVEIDLRVAQSLLAQGRSHEAAVYVESARASLSRRVDSHVVAETYLLSALVALQANDHESARAHATAGLEAIRYGERPDVETALVVPLLNVRGRSLVATEAYSDAVEDFTVASTLSPSPLPAEVLLQYAVSLAATERVPDALAEIERRNRIYGYDYSGLLTEVSLYEAEKQPDMAMLSLAAYFEELRHEQDLSEEEVIGRFEGVVRDSGTDTPAVIKMVEEFFRHNWDVVAAVRLPEGVSDHPAYRYMRAVAGTRAEARAEVRPELLEELVALEEWFRGSQGYYYFLWSAFKNGSGRYSLEAMTPTLERAILLAPESERADETRRELVRLMGLPPEAASHILLREEIDILFSRALSSADASPLARVFDVLALPDNRYTTYAVVALGSINHVPWVREALEARLAVSDGRLAERLRSVLST